MRLSNRWYITITHRYGDSRKWMWGGKRRVERLNSVVVDCWVIAFYKWFIVIDRIVK